MTDFAQQIKDIDKQIVDLTWPGGLFEYEEFRQIYENSTSYYSIACQALSSTEYTEQQKIIIGHSMHGSELSQFLSLAKYVLELLESGKVSLEVFERVAFPTYDWNTSIAKNYDKQDVAQFLYSVLKSNKVDERRKEIIREKILTGKAKSNVSKWQFMFEK